MPTPAPRRSIHPLRLELLKRGIPASRLSRALGYNPNTIGSIIRGDASSWPKLRAAVSAELGVDERRLFPDANRRTRTSEQ